MNSKGALEGPCCHNILKLTPDFLKIQMKSKKNKQRLSYFNDSLETYTRYFRVADDFQIKKCLRYFLVFLL